MRLRLSAAGAIVLAASIAAACGEDPRPAPGGPPPLARLKDDQHQVARAIAKMERDHLRWPDDRTRLSDAARIAWTFLDRSYQPATGFMTPPGVYQFATIWDVGSMLAALHSARGLELVDEAGYHKRVQRILETLTRLPLYDNKAFNKAYNSHTGAAVPPHGWSVIDLGRLFIWLKIIGADPRFTDITEAIVRRTDFIPMIKAGYLWGESMERDGRREVYQEGTIGYEQYAARGFALWDRPAAKALNWRENALPISVMGQPLVADYRRWDRLTAEPFLLWGLELGWEPDTAALVRRLLRAQETRYKKTGLVTITGEDAVDQAPYYFYYYCVYANGKEFAVDVQDRRAVIDEPRWISAKSAFAFHALMPSQYTDVAVRAVADARGGAGGWAAGVFEGTGKSTGNDSLNTAAVILTAALFDRRGEPILAGTRPVADRAASTQ